MLNKMPPLAGVKLALKNIYKTLKRDAKLNRANHDNTKAPAINSLLENQNALYIAPQITFNGAKKLKASSKRYYLTGISSKPAYDDIGLIRLASRAGYQAARIGLTPLTPKQQMRKGYSKEQSAAYVRAYEKSAGCPETQKIRRVKLAGYQAAKYGCKRPSLCKLQRRGYTPPQITLYYETYDRHVGTPIVQQKRKADRMVSQFVNKDFKIPTEAQLIKRGFDKEVIEYFYKALKKKRDANGK